MAPVRASTFLILGADDQTVPIGVPGRAADAAIPGSTLRVDAGGSHALPFTHAEGLTRDPVAFPNS